MKTNQKNPSEQTKNNDIDLLLNEVNKALQKLDEILSSSQQEEEEERDSE